MTNDANIRKMEEQDFELFWESLLKSNGHKYKNIPS